MLPPKKRLPGSGKNMKRFILRFWLVPIVLLAALSTASTRATEINTNELRAQFFRLCDVAIAHVTNPDSKG
ncbi:MAG TPA: hypothetical protein VFM25_08620, partial [Verrucomicrobiae bacterium]|nr:hypothetical protein [Verrucomicrobiae bacterium]